MPCFPAIPSTAFRDSVLVLTGREPESAVCQHSLATHMPAESVAQRRETGAGLGGVNLNSKRSALSP